jgi:hypothetical protein
LRGECETAWQEISPAAFDECSPFLFPAAFAAGVLSAVCFHQHLQANSGKHAQTADSGQLITVFGEKMPLNTKTSGKINQP